nr:MAG TPA_asm: hypothetical protein [Caudoviricetes sp.]
MTRCYTGSILRVKGGSKAGKEGYLLFNNLVSRWKCGN